MKTVQNMSNLLTPYKDTTVVLLEQFSNASNELEIKTDTGAVCIDINTLNFTYLGMFGGFVCSSVINNKVMNDTAKKIIILIKYTEGYINKFGSHKVNIITK